MSFALELKRSLTHASHLKKINIHNAVEKSLQLYLSLLFHFIHPILQMQAN